MSRPSRRGLGRLVPRDNPPLALTLVVFGSYLLLMSGHVYSPDEETMLALSRSLVERGSWVMEPQGGLFQVEGVGGKLYSEKGPGQSLFAVPWTALGLLLGGAYPPPQSDFVLQFVLGAYNALVGAGMVGLLAALGMAMGFSRRASLTAGAALGFSTFLWPTGRTFFAEPVLGLCLLASFYLLYVGLHRATNPTPWLIFSGVLFAAAVAAKVQGAIALPAYLLYIAVAGAAAESRGSRVEGRVGVQDQQSPTSTDPRPPTPDSASSARPSVLGPRPLAIAIWLVGLAAGMVPYLLYNWLTFGGPFSTGYGYGTSITNFDTPLYEGIYGLLLSPGKGLILYAPPVLLLLWGWQRFAREHRAEAWFVGVLAATMLAVFGSFAVWHGDGAWGPRFLVPLLPFLLLPALPVIAGLRAEDRGPSGDQAVGGRRSGAGWRFDVRAFWVATLMGVGFFVNLLGAAVNFDAYLNVGVEGRERYWYPQTSPIAGHWGLFTAQMRGVALRLLPRNDTFYLTDGFSYSEGNKARGNLLPRWTDGEGTMSLTLESPPSSVTFRLADHRPPDLPRATISILADGEELELSRSPVEGQPASTDYSFNLNRGPERLVIKSSTWNPSSLPGGGRDEELGVSLERVEINGRMAQIVEAMPAPEYSPAPLWYYDLRTPFAADWWPVYLPEAQMGTKGLLLLALPLLLVAGASIGLGAAGLRREE
jgi:hypothetical protein